MGNPVSNVGYERWLVARGNVFLPGAGAIVKLVERLRADRWIADPKDPRFAALRFQGKRAEHARQSGGYGVHTVENAYGNDVDAKIAASTEPLPSALNEEWLEAPEREELRLVWPVAASGDGELPVNYPLSRKPEGEVRYALEVHRAPDYVYPVSKYIGALPTLCACSEDLSFGWDTEELVPAFGASTGIFAECDECSRTFDPSKGVATLTNPFDGTKEEVRGGAAYRLALKVDCGRSFAADPKIAFAPELVALVEAVFGRSFYEFGAAYGAG